MKIFLDTANVAEIREGIALGVVDGVDHQPVASRPRRSGRSEPLGQGDLLDRHRGERRAWKSWPPTSRAW